MRGYYSFTRTGPQHVSAAPGMADLRHRLLHGASSMRRDKDQTGGRHGAAQRRDRARSLSNSEGQWGRCLSDETKPARSTCKTMATRSTFAISGSSNGPPPDDLGSTSRNRPTAEGCLGQLPHPDGTCGRFSQALGGPQVYIKRDDCNRAGLRGNKTRHNEFPDRRRDFGRGRHHRLGAGVAEQQLPANRCGLRQGWARHSPRLWATVALRRSRLGAGNLLLESSARRRMSKSSRKDRSRSRRPHRP